VKRCPTWLDGTRNLVLEGAACPQHGENMVIEPPGLPHRFKDALIALLTHIIYTAINFQSKCDEVFNKFSISNRHKK
jgi:hypothetical protein